MKLTLVAVFGVIVCIGSAWSYSNRECNSFRAALDDINESIENEARKHGFSFYGVPEYYTSKVAHALRKMNEKIRNPPYANRVSSQCRSLEDAIKQKSYEIGLEVEGLEDGATRLNKLVDFLKQQHGHQFNEADRQQNLQKQMGAEIESLQQQLGDAQDKIASFNHTVRSEQTKYRILQEEYHKLLAKLHKNSPAIHGKNGTVSGLDVSTRSPETLGLVPTNSSTANDNSTTLTTTPSSNTELDAVTTPSTKPSTVPDKFDPDVRMGESAESKDGGKPKKQE